jgi:hypothetical protein
MLTLGFQRFLACRLHGHFTNFGIITFTQHASNQLLTTLINAGHGHHMPV